MKAKLLHILIYCFLFATNTLFADSDEPLFNSGVSYNKPYVSQGTEFLSVEQAFQLSATIQDGQLILNWNISPGYYLFQDRFNFYDLDNVSLNIQPVYEAGKSIYDDYYEKNIIVHYGQTKFSVPLKNLKEITIIESQGCADAGLCYPIRRQIISLIDNDTVPLITEAPQQNFSANGLKKAADFTVTGEVRLNSLPVMLALAFLGGLILNLMPCVFPILSIKVLNLASINSSSNSKYLHGVAYAFGVILSFAAIGSLLLILRSAGESIGWGFQLQSPVFVGLLVYLFVLMGLTFSGWLTLGGGLMNWGQATTEGDSLTSTFMVGLLATLVASPCTAPFMGTALGFALTQPIWVALSTFIFLGFGMAFPILLITCLPSLSKRLPRPGLWMDHFKQFLAFPLYMTSVWLLWVLGRQTNSDALSAILAGIVFMLFGIWLLKINRTRIMHLIAIAFFLLAAFLPLWNAADSSKNTKNIWKSYSKDSLSTLLSKETAVFVNLTADWCITCLVNEKIVLNSESFLAALDKQNIVYLKGDWTSYDQSITELLNAHNRSGVPLYLFYPAGMTVPIILPQILTISSTIDALSTKIR